MTGAGFAPGGMYRPPLWSIGSHVLSTTRGGGGNSGATTNTAWVANLGVYVPFSITRYMTIYEWWWYNGTLTTAHNVDFGVYNLDFTKIQSLGATAGATTASAIVDTTTWTNLTLAAGSYYMAFSDSSTRNLSTSADAVGLYQASGVMEQTSVGTLPSPAVPVTYTRAFLPHFGMHCRDIAL